MFLFFGINGAREIYTRDALAVSEEHSEEVNSDMPWMAFISDQMVPRENTSDASANDESFPVECRRKFCYFSPGTRVKQVLKVDPAGYQVIYIQLQRMLTLLYYTAADTSFLRRKCIWVYGGYQR